MNEDQPPTFSQLVSGAPPVRAAFSLHRPTRRWWRTILWLHGKPLDVALTRSERTRRITDGFRFYAGLYRLLGVLFLLLSPALLLLNVAYSGTASIYGAGASFLAAAYLWYVSDLGFAGAQAYCDGLDRGRVSLLAFMVMVVAFLSLFVAAVSVVVHHGGWLSPLPNLAAAAVLFVFGVGSYLIEIVYLATEGLTPT